AAKAIRPVDLVDRPVGPIDCLSERWPAGRDIKNAASVRDNVVAHPGCAGVKDGDAWNLARFGKTTDHTAFARLSGVARSRHHDGDSGVRESLQPPAAGEAAGGAGEQLRQWIVLQAHH